MTTKSVDLHECIEESLDHWGTGPGGALNVLNDIQDSFRYVPVSALYELSVRTPWHFSDLCSIVSSFENLTSERVGEHLVLVCDGTACHSVGSVDAIKALEDKLGIACGETTPDGVYTLKSVYCIGACSLAPVVIADGDTFGRIRLARLDEVLASLKPKEDRL